MTDLLARLEVRVVLGVLLALALVLVARRLGRRRELQAYAAVLVLTAVAYFLFGLLHGAPGRHLALEAVGAVAYTLAAVLGARRWPLLLAVGWTGHVAWDLFVHYAGGPNFAPAWYPVLCVGFDLFLGGYIAGAVTRPLPERA
jgi:hypothetical protein